MLVFKSLIKRGFIYNYNQYTMSLFRFLWKTTSAITRTTFYLGGLYTFFAYFYVQEIKYRLGDNEHAYNKIR